MKLFVLLAFACCMAYEISADTATGNHSYKPNKFSKFRECVSSKLPPVQLKHYKYCSSRRGPTDVGKFRAGIKCAVHTYGIWLSPHKVNLKSVQGAVRLIKASPDLKKAFTECPRDPQNENEEKFVKCVIDHLSVGCK